MELSSPGRLSVFDRIGARAVVSAAVLLLAVVAAVPAGAPSPKFHGAAVDTLGPGAPGAARSRADSLDGPRLPVVLVRMKDGGEIRIELYPEEAPLAVERFIGLVSEDFYDGLKFHRVESYLVQAGARESELEPVEGEMFGQELKHREGMVGMARLPNDYDSATNQFYICKRDLPKLNGEYTLFGRVVSGMDIVHSMKKGAKIASITMVE